MLKEEKVKKIMKKKEREREESNKELLRKEIKFLLLVSDNYCDQKREFMSS